MKTVGIIVIGDEILKGQVADQNLAYLAPRLHNLGIKLQKVSVISDSVEEIAKEVAEYSIKYDTVITTGGIGPTHDDVTYEGVAAAFGETVVISQEIIKFWTYFTLDPEGKTAATQKLASIPKSSVVLYPEVPKNVVSKGKFPVVTMKNVIILPGVPKFLQIIFNALEGSYFSSHGVVFFNKTIHLNASEQQITDILNETVKKYSPVVQFGSYPKYDNAYYRVIITLESENMDDLNRAHNYLISKLNEDWLTKDGDLLSNAYKNTMNLIDSKKLGNFSSVLEKSIQIVEKCFDEYRDEEVFISFNGGKDCTALLHLVHSVMVKKFGQQPYPALTGVYFRPPNAFKEIEDFIYECASRYNVHLIIRDGPIKQGLEALLKKEGSRWKACLMGVRRNDPNCKNLNNFQGTDEGWPCLMRVSPIIDWTFQDVWTYLKELQIPYCTLYDRGKLILNDKPLEEFQRRAEEICNLLSGAIGPSGRSVIISNSGTIIITKSSLDIISVFDLKICPERKFILDCMKNLDRDIGDGSKSFIIMLSALLLHSAKLSRDYLTKQCTIFFNFLCNINSTVNEKCDFNKIIDTFFSTKFPIHTSSFLSTLFKEWVENNKNAFSGNIFQNLSFYFDTLVTVEEKGTPLTESRTVNGLCVHGHFHGRFPKSDQFVKLIIIYMSEENNGNEDDLNTDIREISAHLKSLHDSDVLIVTNCILPAASMQLLIKYHLITHVASESVYLLHNYVLHNKIRTGSYPEVKVFNTCNSFRTDLIIMVPFSHFILFAPSKTLSNSYISSLKSCLKLCSYALANKSLLVECVKFEKLLSINLLKNAKSSNIFSKGEQELFDIQCSDYLLNSKLVQLNLDDKKLDTTDELVIEVINSKLPVLESDVISIIIKMLNEYIFKASSCDIKGFEPLKLKIDVLIRVFSTFLSIIRIDKVLKVKKC